MSSTPHEPRLTHALRELLWSRRTAALATRDEAGAPAVSLVPFAVYSHRAIAENSRIELLAPRHGGHVACLARQTPRFWADEAILDWRSRI